MNGVVHMPDVADDKKGLPRDDKKNGKNLMTPVRIVVLTTLTMIAFAGNSLLCRMALAHSIIDAASFTSIRLLSGALMLWLVVRLTATRQVASGIPGMPGMSDSSALKGKPGENGNWGSALALFVYAASFSFAYASLTAATGALLLFSAVQATMIGHGLYSGERINRMQLLGLLLSVAGLVGLLLPGLAAPSLPGSLMMLSSGTAWGIYSLRGKGIQDPLRATAGNFWRAVPAAIGFSLLMSGRFSLDSVGLLCALASGALTSGLGYALWYAVLPVLKVTQASTVQLSVPVIAALGGVLFLDEALSARMLLASTAILCGIALVIVEKRRPADA